MSSNSINTAPAPAPARVRASIAFISYLAQSEAGKYAVWQSGIESGIRNPVTARISATGVSLMGFAEFCAQAGVTGLPVRRAPAINSPEVAANPAEEAPIPASDDAAVKEEMPTVALGGLEVWSLPEEEVLKGHASNTTLLDLGLQTNVLHRVRVPGKMPQPMLRADNPSVSSILFIILAKAGILELKTIERLYKLYVPGKTIRNQTIRSALTTGGCFFRTEDGKAWRLGNIDEPLQAKAPGGAKRKANDDQPAPSKRAKTSSKAASKAVVPPANPPVAANKKPKVAQFRTQLPANGPDRTPAAPRPLPTPDEMRATENNVALLATRPGPWGKACKSLHRMFKKMDKDAGIDFLPPKNEPHNESTRK